MSNKRKGDAFSSEQEVLQSAQEVVNNPALSVEEIRAGFSRLCEEYEKLLDEAKFITKVSDKLEAKLNKANENLQKNNLELSTEVEIKAGEIDKTLQSNKQLRRQKSELDEKQNQLQMTLIIIIAVLLVVMVIFIWLLFKFKGDADSMEKSKQNLQKELQHFKNQPPPPGVDETKKKPDGSNIIYYYN